MYMNLLFKLEALSVIYCPAQALGLDPSIGGTRDLIANCSLLAL